MRIVDALYLSNDKSLTSLPTVRKCMLDWTLISDKRQTPKLYIEVLLIFSVRNSHLDFYLKKKNKKSVKCLMNV